MRRWLAALVAVALPCLVFALANALSDRLFPFGRTTAGRERRAAVAIRDHVPAYQKWATKCFALPSLERYYGAAWYFTQTQTDGDSQKEPFLAALAFALDHYEEVDIFLFAHSNNVVNWVAELEPRQRARIRFVYNAGCNDAYQAPRWLELGAETYVGHTGKGVSPAFFYYFLRRWTHGYDVETAVDESNAATRLFLARAELLSAGKLDGKGWAEKSLARSFGDGTLTLSGARK
jgi:hypothetical protein